MSFPRVHLFVDSSCPALISGNITGWTQPAKLVAMIGPYNRQVSPLGSTAARAIHSWHKLAHERHQRSKPEVELIIEGELPLLLVLGLGHYITGVYRFADAQSMQRAEEFEQINEYLEDFSSAVSRVSTALSNAVSGINELNTAGESLDISVTEEIDAELHASDSSALAQAMQELAAGFAVDYATGAAKAA